jgi:branched-subunit amino acid ABC-type transport system permease component
VLVVALVAIVSVEDAPVLVVVPVVAVVLVAAVSVALVPVALAPVDDTPVSTAAVSVLALLSFLQPVASAVTTSRTATNDLFMRSDSSMIFTGGVARKDERTALNERL